MTHLLCLNATVSQIELESLKNETDIFSRERKARVEQTLEDRRKKAADLTSIWHAGESGLRPGVFEKRQYQLSYLSARGWMRLKKPSESWKRRSTNSKLRSVKVATNKPVNFGSQPYPNWSVSCLRRPSKPRAPLVPLSSMIVSPPVILPVLWPAPLGFRFKAC